MDLRGTLPVWGWVILAMESECVLASMSNVFFSDVILKVDDVRTTVLSR